MMASKNTITTRASEKGSAKITVLVIFLLAVIGGGAYYMKDKDIAAPEKVKEETVAAKTENTLEQQVASLETQSGEEEEETATTKEESSFVIEAGNPIVAILDGKEIKREDILRFIQQMAPQIKRQPIETLYPFALDQLINNQLISQKVAGADLGDDPMVREQMAAIKNNVIRTVFMQKEVEKRITEARIKKEYEQYKKAFPDVEEVKAAHILVEDEAKAKTLIEELDTGADFAELAKINSKDNSALEGGVLNYFTKTEVVPAFAEAAFAIKVGEYSESPVKSKFGYHIIKVQEKRNRPPVDFETAKPQIQVQLRSVILEEVLQEWKDSAKVEKFDINGK